MQSFLSKPMYRYLLVLTLCSTGGLQVWRTLFDNYAVHIVGLDGNHIGLIQSFRELPGFLSFLVIYLGLIVKEHKIAAFSVAILGLGVAITGFFPSFVGVIFTTLMMSLGFHYFEATNQSLTLQYFTKLEAPLALGRLRSSASACNVCIGLFFLFLAPYLSYQNIYLGFGLIIIIAVIFVGRSQPTSNNIPIQKKKIILKSRYWLFYLLTFFAGARRQIFIAFAVFLLVKKFNFSLSEIAILFLVNNLINYFLSPYIGKAIVKFGERKVLSVEYIALIFVFCGYALVEHKYSAATLYVLDHIFFNFSIAIKTFFQKIGAPEDIAPTMAVGFTINHIAAVFLPAIGGFLWIIDYRLVFLGGALLSLFSLISVQQISSCLTKFNESISDNK